MVPARGEGKGQMDQLAVSSKSCPDCASDMPETAAFCPGCGRTMQLTPRAQGKVGAFPESIAGALAYFTFIPAILFLLIQPYRSNQFVRFHSVQCLLFWLASVAVASVLRLLGLVTSSIPRVGPLFLVLIATVSALAAFLAWIVLIVKALQGEMFQLPWLGPLAEERANPTRER